jgi:hypothetical protein
MILKSTDGNNHGHDGEWAEGSYLKTNLEIIGREVWKKFLPKQDMYCFVKRIWNDKPCIVIRPIRLINAE